MTQVDIRCPNCVDAISKDIKLLGIGTMGGDWKASAPGPFMCWVVNGNPACKEIKGDNNGKV